MTHRSPSRRYTARKPVGKRLGKNRAALDVVITYHDRPDTVVRVLDALVQQDYPMGKIVVVDNGSRVGFPRTQQSYGDLSLVTLAENAGPARARNVGLVETASEFVLFLDDDIYPASQCASQLVMSASETSAAVVCPRIVFHPEDSHIQSDGASIHFVGAMVLNNRDAPVASRAELRHPCGAFGTGCFLARRQVLADLGGFDEDFFFYFEDLELSYRLKALGFELWCEPRAVVSHDLGSGTPGLSFRKGGAYPPKRAYFTLRHRWLTILLHYEFRTLLVLAPALALYEAAALLECLRRGWLRIWWQAGWSLLRNMGGVLARRRKWQAKRRVGDRAILVGGPLPFAASFVSPGFVKRSVAALDWLLGRYWTWCSPWL